MGSVVHVKGIKGTPEFFVELSELERASQATEAVPGTLWHVVRAYMRSPQWGSLRPKTRVSYQRALEILKPLEKMPLHKITRPFIFALRDTKILPRRGSWHANYVRNGNEDLARLCTRSRLDSRKPALRQNQKTQSREAGWARKSTVVSG
jgi:hypothetical protein